MVEEFESCGGEGLVGAEGEGELVAPGLEAVRQSVTTHEPLIAVSFV